MSADRIPRGRLSMRGEATLLKDEYGSVVARVLQPRSPRELRAMRRRIVARS